MLLEHIAINVPDSVAMADWYVEHCYMRIVLAVDGEPHTRFLADKEGKTCIEIYTNTKAPIPDYSQIHPATYHNAFSVEDLEGERDRLIAAGATFVSDTPKPGGTRLLMLRDPWQIPLQLVKRPKYWY